MLQQNDERSANLVQSDEEGVGRTERFPQVLLLVAQTNYATMAGREQLDDGVGNTFVLLWLRTQRGEGVQAAIERRQFRGET